MKTKLIILLLSYCGFCNAQDWKLLRTIELTEPLASVSIDPEGRIYLSSTQGNVQRLLPDGQQDEYFSDIANSPVTLTEAWNKFKIFLFFRDLQKVTFLDRFTTSPVTYDISTYNLEYAWLVTPGIDNSIWMLVSNFNELRKYNIQTKQLISFTPLSIDVNQATHIRAYQNLLIIADRRQGLYFFDQFGNLIRKHEAKGIQYFQVSGGKIIYLQGEDIYIMDPFSSNLPEKIKAPEGAFDRVLISGPNHFFIQKNRILIYQRTYEPR